MRSRHHFWQVYPTSDSHCAMVMLQGEAEPSLIYLKVVERMKRRGGELHTLL